MSVDFSAFNTNKMLSSVPTTLDSTHTGAALRAPLSVTTSPVAVVASTARQQPQQQQQQQPQAQHPITTTKMGSRRIFSAQFKLQVLDSYRQDSDCKGNQRATARKYGIHRRQIQKWLQGESNLRSSIILNNNNNSTSSNNNNNNGSSTAHNGKMVTSNGSKRLHENGHSAKGALNQTVTTMPLMESNMPLDASNGFIAFKQESHVDRTPVAVSFASAMPAPHALDSSSAISPAFGHGNLPWPLPLQSHLNHFPEMDEIARWPNFDAPHHPHHHHHHHHHHQVAAASAVAYPFYDYHHSIYAGIPAYLTMQPTPSASLPSQAIAPLPMRSQSTTNEIKTVKSELVHPQIHSPIDLSLPMPRQSHSPTFIAKPRPFLPLSMPNDDISHIKIEKSTPTTHSNGCAGGSGLTDEQKPWDLSRKRRHTDDSDDDEGISVLVSVKTSPAPAKVVKLFKPYLLSSDDEDDDAGKKCLTSDATKVNRTPNQIQQTSFYDNHGSPVSGYDSASSTFSACDDEISAAADATTCDHIKTEHSTVEDIKTKYMVPRRHILEKWSHEEDDAYAHQYGLNYRM